MSNLLLHLIKRLELDRKTEFSAILTHAIERLRQLSRASPCKLIHGAYVHAHSNCPDVIDHPFQPHVAHVHHEVESGCRMCGMHTEEVQLPTSAQVQVQVPLALPVAYAMHSTHAILGPGHGFDTKAADGMPDASRFASSPNIPCSAVLARPLNELPHEAHELSELRAGV